MVTRDDLKRDFIGKEAMPVITRGKIENADEVIDSFEKAMYFAAEQKGKGVLNVIQKEAIQHMAEVDKSIPGFLRTIKKMNLLVKKGLLLGGYTWAVNNYWSNMRQAYVNSGVMGIVDGVRLANVADDTIADIQKMFLHKGTDTPIFKYKGADTDDMLRLGVLEDSHMQSINNIAEVDKRFLFDAETLAKMAETEQKKGHFSRGLDWTAEKMDKFSQGTLFAPEFTKKMNKITGELEGGIGLPHYTRQVGSYIEAVFRAQTYQNQLKMLRGSYSDTLAKTVGKEAADESLKKEAVRITNEVFFDYGKLNYFEKSFVREIVPFYSFYKQNFLYQAKTLFQPGRAVRQNVLAKATRGAYAGIEAQTELEKAQLPPYLNDQNAFTYKTPDGQTKAVYSTSDPSQAMFQMLSKQYWSKGLAQQLNPVLKSITEQLIADKDLFRGEAFDPKDISNRVENQKKYLFARGHAMGKAYNLISTVMKDKPAVWLDKKGNPVTDQEWVARTENVMSWAASMFATVPVSLYGQYMKVQTGKQTPEQALLNIYGPVRETTLRDSQMKSALRDYFEKQKSERLEPINEGIRRAGGRSI